MKQRVLADWHIPPTDPRLGKMNTARWIMAHQMILDGERRTVRRIARVLGTDVDALGEEPSDFKFGDTPRVMPLAALLNPETYQKFADSDHTPPEEGEAVADDAYEAQVKALERAGVLTEIDMLSEQADAVLKKKLSDDHLVPEMDDEEWERVLKSKK